MSRTDSMMRLAISGVLAAASVAGASVASASQEGMEQCAGVIKAGKNDCATDTNACHGHVTTDANRMAWIYLPTGTCAKIAGARVVKVKDPTPTNKGK
jgi:uncharacterized membrane protein